MKRRICYITGTRADFGLIESTLARINNDPELELFIIVTGMHLSARHGMTVQEIESSTLPIAARIEVNVDSPNGSTMASNIGRMLMGFVLELKSLKPDVVLLLGDRGEMLAGAIAAIHLNIPIAHVHGGERSGTVDEPVRHAISKLSHFHFVATKEARERLIRMGEREDRISVTGAPGLDGLIELATIPRTRLLTDAGLCAEAPVALLLFHPVLQEADLAGDQVRRVLSVLDRTGVQIVALAPNSDAGSEALLAILTSRKGGPRFHLESHYPRHQFVSWMSHADLMIGNSSAGIIEAASFGTPVINIGSRQCLRECSTNVVNSSFDPDELEAAVRGALKLGRCTTYNVYGDGRSGQRIVSLLKSLPLGSEVLAKINAY